MTNSIWVGPLTGIFLASHVLAVDNHVHDHEGTANPGARRTQATNWVARAPTNSLGVAATDQLVLPPLPKGVAELKLADFFKPIGSRGLEYTDKIRTLAGKKVRLLGYMVRQGEPKPGVFLIVPVPLRLHEHEYGLAEDMPATVVHAFPIVETNTVVPFTPACCC